MPETPKKHPLKLKITNKTPKAKFHFFFLYFDVV